MITMTTNSSTSVKPWRWFGDFGDVMEWIKQFSSVVIGLWLKRLGGTRKPKIESRPGLPPSRGKVVKEVMSEQWEMRMKSRRSKGFEPRKGAK